MLVLALAVLPAHACNSQDHDDDDDDDAPPAAVIDDGSDDGQHLQLQYGMQFLPDRPGHGLSARFVGERGVYLMSELRYTPGSDVVGVGRVGAGVDLLGRSNFDLTFGLFIGAAGEWDRQIDRAVLYAAPIGGTEVGLGFETDRLFARYRWLAGWGAGPVDEMLTENELTVGYRVLPRIHAIGQFLVLSPGRHGSEAGVGLGLRVTL